MTNSNDALRAARKVYAKYGERKAKEGGVGINKEWVLKVLAGEADGTHGVQIALLALQSAPPSPVAGGDLREVRTTDGYPVNSFSLQDILAEMLAVATASLTEDEDILDDWPLDCRADVDRWQAVICGHLAALNQPAAPVEVVVAYASPAQMAAMGDPIDDQGGAYIPLRKTPAGKFTMPLYAHPPEPAASAVAVPAFATVEMVAAGLKTGSRYGPSAMRNIWREMYLAATHPKGSSNGQ